MDVDLEELGLPRKIMRQPGREVFRSLCPTRRIDPFLLAAQLDAKLRKQDKLWPLESGRPERMDSLECLARALLELRTVEWDDSAQDCITAFAKTAWDKPHGKHINVARFERMVDTPTEDWKLFGDRLVEMIKALRHYGQKFSPYSIFDLVWLRALWVDMEHVQMDYEAKNEKHFPVVICSAFFLNLPASGPNHG